MKDETMCCIENCDQPGTIHANHENASLYCVNHGKCGHCHDSVEYFVFAEDIGIWLCPCVASRRFEELPVKIHVAPKVIEKSTKGVVDFWNKSA
jgi:hypothetical protein